MNKENSNNKITKVSFGGEDFLESDYSEHWPEEWKITKFKTYPRFPRTPLKDFNLEESIDLGNVLVNRNSNGIGLQKELNVEILSKLLFNSLGMKSHLPHYDGGKSKRFYASAGGALYPIETYVIVAKRMQGLDIGLYHYDVLNNCLSRMWDIPENSKFTLFKEKNNSSVFLVLTSIVGRSQIKYGELAYRFSYIETGIALQNLSLLATSFGVANCILNHDDYLLESLLDIDGENEFVTGFFALDFEELKYGKK